MKRDIGNELLAGIEAIKQGQGTGNRCSAV